MIKAVLTAKIRYTAFRRDPGSSEKNGTGAFSQDIAKCLYLFLRGKAAEKTMLFFFRNKFSYTHCDSPKSEQRK